MSFLFGSTSGISQKMENASAKEDHVDSSLASDANHDGVSVRVDNCVFAIPVGVLKSRSFQQSYLGLLFDGQALPDGTLAAFNDHGALDITGLTTSENFSLLIEHLLSKSPLDKLPVTEIVSGYVQLISELEKWKFPTVKVTIPMVVYSSRRWSNLRGTFQYLRPSQAARLLPQPKALQLCDGSVASICCLKPLPEGCAQMDQVMAELLEEPDKQSEVLGVYRQVTKSADIKMVLLGAWEDSPESTGSPLSSVGRWVTSEDAAAATSRRSCLHTVVLRVGPAGFTQALEGNAADFDASFVFDVPQNKQIYVTTNTQKKENRDALFPFMYRRKNSLLVRFSVSFGIQVQTLTNAASSSPPQMRVVDTGMQGASTSYLNVTPESLDPEVINQQKKNASKLEWRCYHPTLTGVQYRQSFKCVRELGDVQRVTFFQWGALLTRQKMDSHLATISIDEEDLKKIYGEQIAIVVKGASIDRDSLDVAVSASLDRVFVLAGGTLASQVVSPTSSRVEFEILQDKAAGIAFKNARIEVPEGGPWGANLTALRTLGSIAEFDCKTFVYLQSPVSAAICDKFRTLANLEGMVAPVSKSGQS